MEHIKDKIWEPKEAFLIGDQVLSDLNTLSFLTMPMFFSMEDTFWWWGWEKIIGLIQDARGSYILVPNPLDKRGTISHICLH